MHAFYEKFMPPSLSYHLAHSPGVRAGGLFLSPKLSAAPIPVLTIIKRQWLFPSEKIEGPDMLNISPTATTMTIQDRSLQR